MKKISFNVVNILVGVLLLSGTSSCTSKLENASTQNKQTIENDSLLISDDPLTNLIRGNERFVSGKQAHYHQDSLRIKELAKGQHPQVIIVSCSDSRVTPEIIFDQGLGDIFTIRTAGNVMSNYEEGSVEYAVEHVHSKLVVVMGHTGCGAINAMLEAEKGEEIPGHIASIVEALKAETEEKEVLKKRGDNLSFNAVKANVEHGVTQLRNSEPILKERLDEGEIKIIGAIYHLETGIVEFLDF